jgi:hypothetical protein
MYQGVEKAAKGLRSIILQDEKLKEDMVRLAPQILLLTYDENPEVQRTMRELWTVMIDVEKESQIITERWDEIYDSAFKNVENQGNPRSKLASVKALTDLMPNRKWTEIKSHFKEIFLKTLQ